MPAAVLPEVEIGGERAVEAGFEELGENPGLEQGTSLRVGGELLRILDAQEPGREPGIVEVELRGFDQPLVEVLEVRLEEVDDIACLQDVLSADRGISMGPCCRGFG